MRKQIWIIFCIFTGMLCACSRREETAQEPAISPAEENFIVRSVWIKQMEILEYSPNRSASARVKWDFDVLYRDGEQETIIGCIEDKWQYICIGTDGKAEFYSSKEEWENASVHRKLWQ